MSPSDPATATASSSSSATSTAAPEPVPEPGVATDPPTGTAPGSGPDGPTQAAAPLGWLETLQSIWQDLPGLISDRVDLLALELQRAGRALAQIVALLVAAAILGVTAWLALWAGIAVGLVELGLHWSLSLLLVLALNSVIAGLALGRLRLLLPLLRLPATRRHMTPGRSTEPATPRPPVAEGSPPLGQAG